jgi:hypothetical protein
VQHRNVEPGDVVGHQHHRPLHRRLALHHQPNARSSSASDQACTRACCAGARWGRAAPDHEAVEQMNHQAHNAPAGDKVAW